MIFDLFASIAERYMRGDFIEKLVREARLFYLPGRAHEFLPTEIDEEIVYSLGDDFFLPFKTVAIEDTASCIILHDTKKKQKGLQTGRIFSECMPLSKKNLMEMKGADDHIDEIESFEEDLDLPKDAAMITIGTLKMRPTSSKQYEADGVVQGVSLYSKSNGCILAAKDTYIIHESVTPHVIKNAVTAIEEVMYFNTPNRFVLEVEPVKIKKKKISNGMIPRSHQRPKYTLLRPREIRRKMGLPELETKGTKSPHWRRKHFRVLRSERFKKMRGKTLVIEATWIGPSEAVEKGKRYRVMLDL